MSACIHRSVTLLGLVPAAMLLATSANASEAPPHGHDRPTATAGAYAGHLAVGSLLSTTTTAAVYDLPRQHSGAASSAVRVGFVEGRTDTTRSTGSGHAAGTFTGRLDVGRLAGIELDTADTYARPGA